MGKREAGDHDVRRRRGELEALAAGQGLDLDFDVGELAMPAGLPLMTRVLHHAAADGLAVGDLRASGVDVEVELPPRTLERDLQVDVAHA